MAQPPQKKEPKGRRDYKVEQRCHQSTLDQLTQPRDEETHQRRNKIIWGFSHHLKIRIPVQFRSCSRGLPCPVGNHVLVSHAARTHRQSQINTGSPTSRELSGDPAESRVSECSAHQI